MIGNSFDVFRFKFKNPLRDQYSNTQLVSTDYGNIRILDTGGNNPVIMCAPDGPNVLEHHENLIAKLAKDFRVICFEFPGVGFSYPNKNYDYSLEKSAKLIIQIMDIFGVDRAVLAFSCANGFFAIKAANLFPERVIQLFLSQTPSLLSMGAWRDNMIPKILTYPLVGQVVNSFAEKKLAMAWYKYALPKQTDNSDYKNTALNSLGRGGCFCLSGLVQGMSKELDSSLLALQIPSTLIWGKIDYTHRTTDCNSITEHLPECEIIEFAKCGHFPELENSEKYVTLINERFQK